MMARPEVCKQYGHYLVKNHECSDCTHRVCKWCYTDERIIRDYAKEKGEKASFNGPKDMSAVKFHQQRTAIEKPRVEVELPTLPDPPKKKRVRKAKPTSADSEQGPVELRKLLSI
jgi:hypothetical protein